MSVLSVTSPSEFVASENPIVVSLGTALNPFGSDSKTKFRFDVTGLIGNNFYIVFDLNYPAPYTKAFYAKDFPNQDNYFLSNTIKNSAGTTITGNTVQKIANSLADALQKDSFISNVYSINYTGTTVTLAAKQSGSKYILNNGSEVVIHKEDTGIATTGITAATITAGNDYYIGSTIPGYHLYTELYAGLDLQSQFGEVLDINDFVRITETALPFDLSNVHIFDWSKPVKSYLSCPRPALSLETPGYNIDYMKPFYIQYGESYPVVPNSNTRKKFYKGSTGFFWGVNSSLPYEQANNLASYMGVGLGDSYLGVKFLTNSPATKPIYRGQREVLYFVIPKDVSTAYTNITDITLHCDIRFWDGSVLLDAPLNVYKTIIATGNTGNVGGCWYANVSYDLLGLDQIETDNEKLIKTVEFYLLADNFFEYSEKKKYSFPKTDPVNRFGVCFKNDFGTYDTFDFIGLSETQFDRTKKDITLPVTPNTNGAYSQGFKANVSSDVRITKKITVNSGFVNEKTLVWLQELLKSVDIYSYTDDYEHTLTIDGYKYSDANNTNEKSIEITFIQTTFENSVSS